MPAAALNPEIQTLFRRLVKFVATLEPIVTQLIDIYHRRLAALGAVQIDELARLDAEELPLQKELTTQVGIRIVLLREADRLKLNKTNLLGIVRSLAAHTGPNGPIAVEEHSLLLRRMLRMEGLIAMLRKESWANWYAVRRADRDFSAMRALISHGFERQHLNPFVDRVPARGGSLLNARV